ncbi:MAG: hypothetical protein EU532_10385, partial [Promethearchaeota archaeon]
MIISKDTKLCLMNSRWGSRLTFNLNFMEHAIETGNLGIDIAHDRKIRYSHQNLQELKFYVESGSSLQEGFYFSKLKSYLAAQELNLGLTYLTLKGIHSSELKVEFTIHSPIAITSELENDEKIKILHSPFFYVDIEIENNSKVPHEVSTFIGFDMQGQLINKNLVFDDNGKNYIEKDQKKLVLKRLQQDTSKYYKDNEDDSRGFLAYNELKSGEKLTLKYIYAGFIGKPVFLNKLNRRKSQKLKFYYTKFFTDIDNVLDFAEQNYVKI